MPHAVIVVGAVEGVRRDLEGRLGDRAHLLVIRLARQDGFRLEPYPQAAVQMLEGAADRADEPGKVLIIVLPYARCAPQLDETITALTELGATVIRPQSGAGRWPPRPPALDARFQAALRDALLAAIDNWLPGEPPPESVDAAVVRARLQFADTLHISEHVTIDTNLDGAFWYCVLLALHELCELERRGEAANKRDALRDRLAVHIGIPKRTYKVADTGVFGIHPETGVRVELRERVHLVEGRPAETESVYWMTMGDAQASYRYLVGRIGRHA
jgi:hypothetical protein